MRANMQSPQPASRPARAWLAAAVMLAGAWALSGCETTTTVTTVSAGQAEGVSQASASTDRRRAAQIRLDLATNYLGIGRYDVAMEEVGNALAIDPSLVDAYQVRGLIYMQNRDYASADSDFDRVLRARAGDPDIMHNKGFLKCQQALYGEAQKWFDDALQTPGYARRGRTWMAKGLCFDSAGDMDSAIAALKEASILEPGNPIVAYNLASLLYKRGEVANAQTYLRPLNASNLANAETLWLGIKVENAMGNQLQVQELGGVLRHRFPQSREYLLFERKAFYE